jgi:hypothetical protein
MLTTVTANLAARRDAPVVCRVCGRCVERAARQQLYCSRSAGSAARSAFERHLWVEIPARHRTPLKNSTVTMVCEAWNRGRAPPQNLLREVIETEVFAGRTWRLMRSSDGVECWVSTLRPRVVVT